MGKFSKVVLGKDKISRALIVAGTATTGRIRSVLNHFSNHSRVKQEFVKYCHITHDGKEAVLFFSVYGGAPTLELVHLLQDAHCKKILFVGSCYGTKPMPIGTFILPEKVIDRAGLVLLDDPAHKNCTPNPQILREIENCLQKRKYKYYKGTTAAVPCVIHNIPHVSEFVKQSNILGVEMELSTLYHFAHKANIKTGGLVYVSDSPAVHILENTKKIKQAKIDALGSAVEIAKEVLFA